MNRARYLLGLAVFLVSGCGAGIRSATMSAGPVDANATAETRALFANLKRLAPDHVLFGHQDDLAYGVTWKRELGRSDVREATGSYPAVYGWELGDLEHGAVASLDSVRFDDIQRWIREGYDRGGVITIAWHMDNPASGGNSWDTTRAVHAVLPGGTKHEMYKQWLDRFAEFTAGLRGSRGEPIPVIFRPFHEMTGSWFWWGGTNVTSDEYIRLWRFTVDYLRDTKGVNNLLYAYSPDVFNSEEEYLRHYPGDEYVDVLGFDDYQSLRTDEGIPQLTKRLSSVVQLAERRGKLPAFTETGLEGVPAPDWWTGRLLQAIQADPVGRRISYVLVWRNANQADNPGHFYAAYPGQVSAPDMVRFRDSPFVLFGDEVPNLYKTSGRK